MKGKLKKFRICLTGPEEKDALLSDLAGVCNVLNSSLRKIERCLLNTEGKVKFKISDLKHHSAELCIEPLLSESDSNGASDVITTFVDTIEKLEHSEEIDDKLDYSTYEEIRKFRKYFDKNGSRLSINGTFLTHHFVSNVNNIVKPTVSSFGSVSGKLEALNLHKSNTFVLYPVPGDDREQIKCHFEEADLKGVLECVNKKVTVRGELFYSRKKSFPVRVKVEEFQPEEPDENLPSLLSLEGIFEGGTENSVDQIRKLRDEWEHRCT